MSIARATHKRKSVLLQHLILVLPLGRNHHREQLPLLRDHHLGALRRLEVAVVERDGDACSLAIAGMEQLTVVLGLDARVLPETTQSRLGTCARQLSLP